jgi:hypothetical protein
MLTTFEPLLGDVIREIVEGIFMPLVRRTSAGSTASIPT